MRLYLGLDSSTQGLAALVIDADSGRVVHDVAVNYGRDLPQYGCPQGFLANPDPLVKHADPRLWAAALDLLCGRLSAAGVPLRQIRGVSGSGQQHGTVYLREGFPADPAAGEDLAAMVGRHLARPTAPIWMDSSTHAECLEIDAALGGADEVRRRSGSAAIERFSGPQIRRYAKADPQGYAATARIHLVSSFMCSLLVGASAPIDAGDGAGMNLLNLASGDWDDALLAATAPGLRDRLPGVVPSSTVVGTLSPYFVRRHGFAQGTPVVVWSGDNPNSLIGVGGWRPGTAVISLGTSDTYFAAMREPAVDPHGYGHVFGNPAGGFMCLICFKNGSLARERVKETHGLSWPQFDVEAFAATPAGNGGNLMLPYFVPEITPLVLQPACVRRGSQAFQRDADAYAAVRAIVEAQALSMRLHSGWIGTAPDALRVTGGASRSAGICAVLASVFAAPVDRLETGNSAALGAAMRAANGSAGDDWGDLAARSCRCDPARRVVPNAADVAVYRDAIARYAGLEQEFLASCKS